MEPRRPDEDAQVIAAHVQDGAGATQTIAGSLGGASRHLRIDVHQLQEALQEVHRYLDLRAFQGHLLGGQRPDHHAGVLAAQTEEAGASLADDLYIYLRTVQAQLLEGLGDGLIDGFSACLYVFHLCTSC